MIKNRLHPIGGDGFAIRTSPPLAGLFYFLPMPLTSESTARIRNTNTTARRKISICPTVTGASSVTVLPAFPSLPTDSVVWWLLPIVAAGGVVLGYMIRRHRR